MLINKPFQAGDIVTLKLTSGEELLAKYVSENDSGFMLNKPMVLTMGPKGVAMVPYLITGSQDRDIELRKAAVTVVVASDKGAADNYLQGTTGITIAHGNI